MSGSTATARLLGSVHGVVVQISATRRSPAQPDRDRRVLPLPVDVVHPGLGVGQRRLAVPAVGQHAEALVDQALVPQRLERPHHRLHVVGVERLVVVLEVDPAGLPVDVLLPVLGVRQHRRAADVVERLDAHRVDLGLWWMPELLLGLDLGRQPVAVPAEAALDPAPAHGLVARDDVLDVAGEQVAVVRQAVGERRPVVEDELVAAVLAGLALLDAGAEGAVRVPVAHDPLLDRREARARGHLTVRRWSSGPTLGYVIGVSGRRPRRATRSSSARGRRHPARSGRHRGTTSLAGHVPLEGCTRPLVAGCDGPLPSGSTGTGRRGPVLPEAPR